MILRARPAVVADAVGGRAGARVDAKRRAVGAARRRRQHANLAQVEHAAGVRSHRVQHEVDEPAGRAARRHDPRRRRAAAVVLDARHLLRVARSVADRRSIPGGAVAVRTNAQLERQQVKPSALHRREELHRADAPLAPEVEREPDWVGGERVAHEVLVPPALAARQSVDAALGVPIPARGGEHGVRDGERPEVRRLQRHWIGPKSGKL